MAEGILTILKFCLLALVFLFLARVVWVVVAELKGSASLAPPLPAPAPATPPAAEPKKTRRTKPWRLRVVAPAGDAGKAFEVDGELTIGRAPGCGIALPQDSYLSQIHARAIERDGELYVEDLGSTNGTLVNGTRITTPQRIKKGDRVQAGATVLEAAR